jgi:hypothetical protein
MTRTLQQRNTGAEGRFATLRLKNVRCFDVRTPRGKRILNSRLRPPPTVFLHGSRHMVALRESRLVAPKECSEVELLHRICVPFSAQ